MLYVMYVIVSINYIAYAQCCGDNKMYTDTILKCYMQLYPPNNSKSIFYCIQDSFVAVSWYVNVHENS